MFNELHITRESVVALMHWVGTLIEITGVAVIVVAVLTATWIFVFQGLGKVDWTAALHDFRATLGRGILVGLELLVAADIIGTVAVTPSFQSVAVLGLIVLIRTFLSFSLAVEIEGHWPWQRSERQFGQTTHLRWVPSFAAIAEPDAKQSRKRHKCKEPVHPDQQIRRELWHIGPGRWR
jgi:uncharacterized membrane protein